MKILISLIFCFCSFCPCAAWREMVVKTTVADLCTLNEKTNKPRVFSLEDLQGRHKKNPAIYKNQPSIFSKDNPYLITQLLFGERVLVEPWNADWYKVQAPEQKVFHESTWEPCSGFVRTDFLAEYQAAHTTCLTVAKPWSLLYKKEKKLRSVIKTLSLGTCLDGIEKKGSWWIVETPLGQGVIAEADVMEPSDGKDIASLRTAVINTAKLFLGGPYIWGGGSAWKEHTMRQPSGLKDQITGVDCSALVRLAFKVHGLLVTRNSHSQWLSTAPVATGDLLLPGDLIFFADAKQKPLHINHVIMYTGKDEQENDIVLESNGKMNPFGVRMVATKECKRFENKQLSELRNEQKTRWFLEGKEIHEVMYFGSLFTPEKIAELRQDFLRVRK